VRTALPPLEYTTYDTQWQTVARAGMRHANLDVWAGGRRYLSLATLCLTPDQVQELREVTNGFGRLFSRAAAELLEDRAWWPSLAWPWPAIELARQEPAHPDGIVSLFGRFDFLLDEAGHWQVIEFNSDTPSGGREAAGLEPAIARLHHGALRPLSRGIDRRLVSAVQRRIAQHSRPVSLVGVVSSHGWIEDMSQATWLAHLLNRAGQPAIVGDATDLAIDGNGDVLLRGRRIDALYRFYPIERLYRHAVFGSVLEATIEGKLLLLNGLRGFLAQSKACLAWLWANRRSLGKRDRQLIELHLPATVLARDRAASAMLPDSVVKHVNGREGDSVVFGRGLEPAAWEARLLEGGYVVQRAVKPRVVQDVAVDEWNEQVASINERYACVGGFLIDGRFAGVYTRIDGPITSARATYVATLLSDEPLP
jgi:glutathionylspermidine synthase